MTLGLLQDVRYRDHKTGPHPESPGRLESIAERLKASGLLSQLDSATPRLALPEEIAAVHDADYIQRVQRGCRMGLPALDSGDTAVCQDSYEIALLAAGAGLLAADKILTGHWKRAFAAVRPPGHHAEHARAMGFCLFNNVAILARYLQNQHTLERVLILDWDVHHGNGTQHSFEEDPSVFYISLHQWPFYPGTGAHWERGEKQGKGTTLNVPLDAGTGEREYMQAFERLVLPAIEDFRPEFILLSAGFDAHLADPLGSLELTEETFREMTRQIVDVAEQSAAGRIISLLEGGYDLDALARCVESHLEALLP